MLLDLNPVLQLVQPRRLAPKALPSGLKAFRKLSISLRMKGWPLNGHADRALPPLLAFQGKFDDLFVRLMVCPGEHRAGDLGFVLLHLLLVHLAPRPKPSGFIQGDGASIQHLLAAA